MGRVTRDVPPYLPSLAWCRGMEETDTAHYGRSLTRTLIASNSPEGLVLTVPIAGGSATVKRDDPHSFMISSHGDWTRIHLGAFEAAYGREPYFPHFFPGIAEIIEAYPPKLEDLNRRLITTMLRLAGYDREKGGLLSLRDENPERFRAIGDRLMAGVNPRHSMIEALFRYGKEILFLISRDFSFPDSHDKC